MRFLTFFSIIFHKNRRHDFGHNVYKKYVNFKVEWTILFHHIVDIHLILLQKSIFYRQNELNMLIDRSKLSFMISQPQNLRDMIYMVFTYIISLFNYKRLFCMVLCLFNFKYQIFTVLFLFFVIVILIKSPNYFSPLTISLLIKAV